MSKHWIVSAITREQASHWCALMASSNCELMEQVVNGVGEEAHLFTDVCGRELLNADAADLARDAFHAAADQQGRDPGRVRVIVPGGQSMTLGMVNACRLDSREAWAAGESMIRTGWSPS